MTQVHESCWRIGVRMDGPDDPRLHPYRKRKFFYGLAEFLNEPPPVIQRLEDYFANASGTDTDPIQEESIPKPPSQEEEEDSFEYVDFAKSRASLESSASWRHGLPSQSSLHDSMQDSLLFLPPHNHHHDASASLSASADTGTQRASQSTTDPTILSLSGHSMHRVELVDYFDLDRYCEPVPCWAYEHDAACSIHAEPIRRPMVLFSLQALDEMIASAVVNGQDGALIASCRVARIVLAYMWEQDVRQLSTDADLVLAEYVAEKHSLPGVSVDVWKIIDACWHKHKPHFLHHQELSFDDDMDTKRPSERLEHWRRVRYLLQIYGLRPTAARRLEAELPRGSIAVADTLHLSTRGGSHNDKAIALGVEYLQSVNKPNCRRDTLSQSDWKRAFQAIEIHLKEWSRDVQVFPCGAFSRGAAYGSVIDILVGLPPGTVTADEPPIHSIREVLVTTTIVSSDRVRVLSPHRLVAIISFKTKSILLDLKVYERPQSWFALLYFTGPERFVQSYYSSLLQRSLAELAVVDFDHIFDAVQTHLGHKIVASVDSEKHLFDIINAEYLPPPQRL